MLLEWEVLDTTGVEWDVQDGLVVSWLVQQGPVEITGAGTDSSLFRRRYQGLEDSYELDDADGVIGGAGTITLPAPDGDTRAWVISAYTNDIVLDPGEGVVYALDNSTAGTYTIPQGAVAHLLRYVGVWRITYDSSVSGDAAETTYYEDTLSVQPWLQTGADFGASATVNAAAHVTRTATWWVQATLTFASYLDVVTPGTGDPRFLIREVFQSLSEDFAGWYWGWSSPNIRASVHGQIGGLPFVGFVDRQGYILDADGNTVTRVLQSGDHLIGTVTGVFQND